MCFCVSNLALQMCEWDIYLAHIVVLQVSHGQEVDSLLMEHNQIVSMLNEKFSQLQVISYLKN